MGLILVDGRQQVGRSPTRRRARGRSGSGPTAGGGRGEMDEARSLRRRRCGFLAALTYLQPIIILALCAGLAPALCFYILL